MTDFLPFIIVGATSGSIYAIAGLGLVLSYKTTGIFNFAHGAIAAGGGYLFYELWQVRRLPWPVAGVLVVLVAAPLFGILFELLSRGLADVSAAAKIVATIGIMIALQGLIVAIYGSSAINFPRFLPTHSYQFGAVSVTLDQVVTMSMGLIAAVGLYGFFRRARLGIAMRAVVDNSEFLGLLGTNPARVRTYSWMISSSFAALSGVLLAPTLGLDAVLLTLLVVQAFGAAAIGRFSNLLLTYVGGLVIGIGAALSTKYVGDFPALSGFPPSFPFIVLFTVLLLTPKHRLTAVGTETQHRLAASRRLVPRHIQFTGLALGLLVLLLVPAFAEARLPLYTSGVIFALLFASLALLVRTSGQISLAHAALAAVGATSFSHLAHGAGMPWLLALLGAGLVTVPVGAIVAIPAIRLSGLYLALATFGFGLLLERLLYRTFLFFGGTGIRAAPRPSFAQSDQAYYHLALALVLAGVTLTILVTRTRMGRLLRAMADSPVALSMHGASVNVTRVLVFCVSAFLAGIAGGLFAAHSGSVSGVGFDSFLSLSMLTVLYLAGSNVLLAPFLAAFLLAVSPSYFSGSPWFTDYQPVLFGLGAVAAALASNGQFGLYDRLHAATARTQWRRESSPVAARMQTNR